MLGKLLYEEVEEVIGNWSYLSVSNWNMYFIFNATTADNSTDKV